MVALLVIILIFLLPSQIVNVNTFGDSYETGSCGSLTPSTTSQDLCALRQDAAVTMEAESYCNILQDVIGNVNNVSF